MAMTGRKMTTYGWGEVENIPIVGFHDESRTKIDVVVQAILEAVLLFCFMMSFDVVFWEKKERRWKERRRRIERANEETRRTMKGKKRKKERFEHHSTTKRWRTCGSEREEKKREERSERQMVVTGSTRLSNETPPLLVRMPCAAHPPLREETNRQTQHVSVNVTAWTKLILVLPSFLSLHHQLVKTLLLSFKKN